MADRIVITDAESIAAALAFARGRPDCDTRVFDPVLLDKAREAGLPGVELIVPPATTDYPDLVAWARTQAFAIGRQLDGMLQALAPAPSIAAWQHLSLYYLLLSQRWHAELWSARESAFDDAMPALFICDNPSQYYWPSFIPALLLAQRLRAAGREFSAYTFGRRPDLSCQVPAPFEAPPDGCDLLVHVPTAFHDGRYFDEEIRAAGRRTINLRARVWDVPVGADVDVPVVDSKAARAVLDATTLDRIDTFHQRAVEALDAWLQPALAFTEQRLRQAQHIAENYRSQLITFALLQRGFARQLPKRMLLTEYDAGVQGPLVSFAQQHGIPVVMVPHAKTIADVEYLRDGVTALTHPLQTESPSDSASRRLQHCHLAYPERLAGTTDPAGRLRTIGLLLNGIVLGGVLCTDLQAYFDGIRRIAQWCRERGIALHLRSRPGQLMPSLMAQATGIDPAAITAAMNDSLEVYARSVDLCLMYDTPTTAEIEFLKNAVPILNPVPSRLTKAESLACDTTLIPREAVSATLDRLDDFLADSQRLVDFTRRQFATYVGLFAAAQPLRRFL